MSTSIAGSVFNPTEETLKFPPEETLKFPPEAQVFKGIPSYVGQKNVKIQGEEGVVTDKNELVKADGTVLKMKKPSAFKEIKKHKAETDKMRRASKEEEYR